MSRRGAGFVVGVVFGVTLCWTGLSSPNVIRQALLFEDSYLYLFFASAVLTSAIGLRLVRGRRAPLTGERVEWKQPKLQSRHIYGSLIFGTGWAVADACPGPIATQVGQGVWWALFTFGGVLLGVRVFLRRAEETEPATESQQPAASPA